MQTFVQGGLGACGRDLGGRIFYCTKLAGTGV